MLKLVNTPGFLQFIGDRNIHSIEDAKNHLKNDRIKSYSTNGFGLWLVLLKDTNLPIGTCGLIKRDSLKDVDIGFAYLPIHMGKGYAYEAAVATLAHAYDVLKIEKVVAITDEKNKASIKLLEKIGLRLEKKITFMDNDNTLLYSPIKKPN